MKKIILILILIVLVIIGLGWYLGRPLFIDDKVGEELPKEFSDFEMPTEEEIKDMSEEEKEDTEIKVVEMFKDKEVEVIEDMPKSDSFNNKTQIILSGEFKDADNFHKGSGLAKVLENNSNQLLRLENFMVTNGPDLHVLLVENENPANHDGFGRYVDLGSLKGNVGDQNYVIPENIDTSIYKSVVIYCEPFSVVFSTANLN